MRSRLLLPCLLVSPLAALALAVQAGLRYNHTESMPQGVYRMVPKVAAVGDLVTFRPPPLPVFELARERGYVEPGECLLKRLVAAAGDVVTVDAAGVIVNGILGSTDQVTAVAGLPGTGKSTMISETATAWRELTGQAPAMLGVTASAVDTIRGKELTARTFAALVAGFHESERVPVDPVRRPAAARSGSARAAVQAPH